MSFQIGTICVGLVLGATLIVTFILELINQNGMYDGTILQSVMSQYKTNIWHILIAFLWLGGVLLAIELILTFYDGARMRYRLRIEFFERLEDFYYHQLPDIRLVYQKQPTLSIDPHPIQPFSPLIHSQVPPQQMPPQQMPPQQMPPQQMPPQQMPPQQMPGQQMPPQQMPGHIEELDEVPIRRRSARTRRVSY